MKYLIFGSALIAMTACAAPYGDIRTGKAIEDLAASGSSFASTRSITVASSPAQVAATFARLADNCLNRAVTTISTGSRKISFAYKGVLTNDGSGKRLVLFREMSGAAMHLSDATKGDLALASAKMAPAAGGGTVVTLAHLRGLERVTAGMERWAKGDELSCPKL